MWALFSTREHLLGYFELLPQNLHIQIEMEDFIQSYQLTEKTTFQNNLDYITI
jgi:hypothetical protein